MSIGTLKPTMQAATPSLDISPFDSRDNADIVLRTNDGIEFAVRRTMLSDASTIFCTMFQLPQPSDADSVPIIDVDDAGRDLLQLLRWCDPRCEPSFELIDVLRALRLAQKYDMRGVVRTLSKVLTSNLSMPGNQPLEAYAISVEQQLHTQARLALKECLRFTLDELRSVSELDRINGTTVFQIFQNYLKCRERVRAAASAFGLGTCGRYIWGKCRSRHSTDSFKGKNMAGYWNQYLQALAEALYERPRMNHDQLLQTFFNCRATDECWNCSDCRPAVMKDLNTFIHDLELYIDTVIDEALALFLRFEI